MACTCEINPEHGIPFFRTRTAIVPYHNIFLVFSPNGMYVRRRPSFCLHAETSLKLSNRFSGITGLVEIMDDAPILLSP